MKNPTHALWGLLAALPILAGLTLVRARPGPVLAQVPPAGRPVDAVLTLGDPVDVTAPPAVVAAMAEMRHGAGGRQARAPQRLQAVVPITEEKFEGATFPPTGWRLVDNLSVVPQYVWGREACDVDPLKGGSYAVWAVGGGQLGSQLPCVSAYNAPVNSWLVYGPMDTRSFAGGIQVNLLLKLDQPLPAGGQMQLCATVGPAENDMRCRNVSNQKTNWTTFQDPQVFAWAAGHAEASFALHYVDPSPPGNVFGALADNVILEGLTEPVAGTATATSVGPSPTATRRPIPTDTRRPPAGNAVYLPIMWGGAAKSGVTAEFGVDVDDNGNLVQPGTLFQFGIPSLCARIQWRGQAPGASLRWQWFRDGQPWDAAGLDGNLANIPADGVQTSCASYGDDEQGHPIPLPKGRYEVAAYLNGATLPDATAVAVIQTDPPPGATPIPTGPLPTRAPTQVPATPTLTPEPGEPCPELLTNGNFEAGARDWSAFENTQPQQPSRIIVQDSDLTPRPPMVDGSWLAFFGGRPSIQQQLHQTWANGGALIEPSQLISATLRLSFMISSQEAINGTADDWLAPFFGRADGEYEQPDKSTISEEILDQIQAGVWYRAAIDVAPQMTKRPGWDAARLMLVSNHNAANLTSFLVDKVSLRACVRPGTTAAGSVLAAAAGKAVPARLQNAAPPNVRRVAGPALPARSITR